MRIGVIGAGAAGLAAAYDFAGAGHGVTVYEAAPFVGGQASTIEVGGGRLELGYHHLFTNDHAILDLMDELGIGESMQWIPSTVGIYTNQKVYRWSTPIDLLRFSALSLRDRIRMGMVAKKLQRMDDWRALEDTTAAAWIRENAGASVYEKVWEPLLRGKFGDRFETVGMPWFWSKIHTRFASRDRLGREKLGYPANSFDEVFETLTARIRSMGGAVHLETPVTRVLVENGTATGLRVKHPDGTETDEAFDLVLSTTPSFAFPELVDLPDAYLEKLGAVEYMGAVVMILEMTRPLTSVYWMNIADHEVPFLGLIEHTNLMPKEKYGGSYVLYLTNYVERQSEVFLMSTDELLDVYAPHLSRFNLEFDRSWITRVHHNKVSAAQPVMGVNYSRHLPEHQTPLANLFLANTTQIYPEDRGTNYSVRMGRELAAVMLRGG
ncbi:MAG TPA: NAD(P)/FAD-dependent oxidoreductase [Dehalococcoidia bacterium]|jgi:protoporphyrinogen oxidase|nr:amine oxidase [Chloroflexota bacterium]MDP5876619.1 NAD(P)/FAD-dependent oxidoreductase [Dehalococcoidia bacterium]MDP6274135.1 NAD(P)/FAD-dependent oxidoreductase [Dehalococcoidia bacterium]MDP7161155.1 NAD(P)/FAD-dependent oxidoreductase [Dehalococcoidia bacterium]MDP7213203.1 NAD(P)/FAD-dependent oxidoreductase [Dehalococcoidia bacterium]|tara:strand:- start:1439 stop:2749 length:1311 start_codon:yes stop_codon:yes gene_type:complete